MCVHISFFLLSNVSEKLYTSNNNKITLIAIVVNTQIRECDDKKNCIVLKKKKQILYSPQKHRRSNKNKITTL